MATIYRIPRESTEGIGPFTATVDGAPDVTLQGALHAFGVRPTVWFDLETTDGIAQTINVGPGSAHWATLVQGKYRVSIRDKTQPSYERIGVAALYIT